MGHSKRSPEREGHSIIGLPKEARKITNNLTLHIRGLEKELQTKRRVSKRKEIRKNRVEINDIETKKSTNN